MKKLVALLAAAAFGCGVHAQDFEGTLRWGMRAEITDPAMRQQIHSAEAQMASPQLQAQRRQAQEAMNTPEMKAMMAQNPQMREMIERQMAAMPKPGARPGGGPGGMFPRGFMLKVRGASTLVVVDGGMFPSEILAPGDRDIAYQLNRDAKTYRRLNLPSPVPESSAASFQITRTKDTAVVLGYTCTRYLVEQTGGAETASYSVWTTKDIKGLDPKKLRNLRVARGRGPNFMSELDGVPLKVEINTPQAKLTLEAELIQAESLPAAVFELPTDFSETTN